MKYELPCEIVRDLLPNYIDGLTGEATTQSVKSHLDGCDKCRKLYEGMKTPCDAANNAEDGKLFKKMKHKINGKTRRVAAALLAFAVLAAAGIWAGFTVPVRNVSADNLSVSAKVYDMREEIQKPGDNTAEIGLDGGDTVTATVSENGESNDTVVQFAGTDENNLDSVTITMGGEDADYMVYLKDYAIAFGCSEELVENNPYATAYMVRSDYKLNNLDSEIREETDGSVLYLSNAKTALFGAKLTSGRVEWTSMDFADISKIVYSDPAGGETVMWEKG